jgi:hypothetical protein
VFFQKVNFIRPDRRQKKLIILIEGENMGCFVKEPMPCPEIGEKGNSIAKQKN